MKRSMLKLVLVLIVVLSIPTYAATVAHWDFEDGVAGQPFTPAGGAGSGYSSDTVAGYQMHGWDDYWGPGWASQTGTDSGLVMQNADHHQDGYSFDAPLVGWAPSQFTIEATFMLESDGTGDIGGWQTLMGRDSVGTNNAGSFSALYFQKTWDNYFRFDFATAGGERFEVSSFANGLQVQADTWYSMAVISDGTTLSLYVNDIVAGAGWALAGQTDMSAAINSTMDTAAGNWTFGRGWWNGNFVDHIDGYMDEIRFSDTALSTQDLIFVSVPEPATMLLLGLGAVAMLKKRK